MYYFAGINLPDKKIMSNLWSKVSFSDVDPALMLERQEGLDKYIQVFAFLCVLCIVIKLCAIIIFIAEHFQCTASEGQ